jgi:hypothetical protein
MWLHQAHIYDVCNELEIKLKLKDEILIYLTQVDTNECPSIAESENMHRVPSYAIYIEGQKMKEIFNPTHDEFIRWVQDI